MLADPQPINCRQWRQKAVVLMNKLAICSESKDTVRRYIRLTYLIKEIRDMVDDDKLSIRAAVEISYIQPEKQAILVPFMQKYDVTINKAAELREWFDNGGLTDNETVTSLLLINQLKRNLLINRRMLLNISR